MLTLLVFFIVLSILIIVHEFGHFIMAKKVRVKVEKFSLGFGPELFRRKKADTEYLVSAFPLGGFVKLAGDNLQEYKGGPDEYYSKSVWDRFKIIFFGPLLNYILGFVFLWVIFFVGFPHLTTKVGGVLKGFGAERAGILAGDRVIAIDDKKVDYWEDLQQEVQNKRDKDSITVSLIRDGAKLNLDVVIREKQIDDQLGSKQNVGMIGISASDEFVKTKYGFFESAKLAALKTWALTAITYKGLWRLIIGKLSMRDSVTGPLGIFYITSKAVTAGVVEVFYLIAILSISLAIFNLLPLPILDGGHIFLLGIEKIRGKALSIKTEDIINRVGITLVVSLAIFVTYNDILRFFGEKISKIIK